MYIHLMCVFLYWGQNKTLKATDLIKEKDINQSY